MISNTDDSNTENSNRSPYAVLTIDGLLRKNEELVTSLLFESGADGVSEDLPFIQKSLRYDPEVIETADVVLKAYFTRPPAESERLKLEIALKNIEASIRVSMALEEHRDWLEEWKKGFIPFLFAEPFWVVPKWCDAPDGIKKEHIVLMDPGMAFGTGTHETTRLAARLIVEKLNSGGIAGSIGHLLDVGTGTGILALIAERLGVQKAMGLDIDPEARRTARENLTLNQSKKTVIDDRSIQDVSKACLREQIFFDLTIANIIDGVLLQLAQDLEATVRPGGGLILSGILQDREADFHRKFANLTGLTLVKKIAEGEWCASLWKKES